MKNKDRKKLQKEFATSNIELFFGLLEKRFNPDFDEMYVREIKRLSEGFNIRLSREQKLKFCKNCHCFWNAKTREIRMNSDLKCKEYICKNCGFVRRYKYK